MSCLMLRFDTWPAGELGTSVCTPMSFGLALKPSKNAVQYLRLPPGSFDEEQRLVSFDSCCNNVPIETGPPVPPVSVGPEEVAVKDAFANCGLKVTAVDNG